MITLNNCDKRNDSSYLLGFVNMTQSFFSFENVLFYRKTIILIKNPFLFLKNEQKNSSGHFKIKFFFHFFYE